MQDDNKQIVPEKSSNNKVALFAAAIVCLVSIGVFAFKAKETMDNRPPERLRLGEDVKIEAPPSVPDSDAPALRLQLNAIEPVRAVALSTRKPGDLVKLATAGINANDLLSARFALEKAIKGRTDVPFVVMDMLGRCYLELGNPDRSLMLYNELIKSYPLRAEAYVGKSRSLTALGRTAERTAPLLEALTKVEKSDRGGLIYLATEFDRLRDLSKALSAAQKALQSNPEDTTIKILNAGVLYKLGKYDDAATLLKGVIQADPKNGPAHRMYAQILDSDLTGKRNRTEAEHFFLLALQISDKDADAAWRLANSCIEQNRNRQASYLLTLLLKSVPDSAAAREQLSKVSAKIGDLQISKEQAAIAQTLLKRNAEEAELKANVERNQTSAEDHLALGKHFAKYGQYKPALLELEATYNLNQVLGAAPLKDLYQTVGSPMPLYEISGK